MEVSDRRRGRKVIRFDYDACVLMIESLVLEECASSGRALHSAVTSS